MTVSFEKEKWDIRKSQKEQLTCMLNLGCEAKANESSLTMNEADPWKFLIYDEACQAIIAPAFAVHQLQAEGITLYLSIDSKREQVPNVGAVYFVRPTMKNLDKIANDMASGLYDRFYLNFSMGLDRKGLEHLANQLIETNSYKRLTKVFDQHVDFVALSPNLFDLNIKDCYQNLHKTGVDRDSIILSLMENITNSLFCSIVTLQKIPIIRAQKGSAAQRIAESLANKLTKHLQSRNNLFSQSGHAAYQNRPVLCILDRSIDFAIPLHHSPIYQSLLHDLLDLRHNLVQLPNGDTNKKETILLDFESDQFWQENYLKPFPSVHKAHDDLLQWYKDKQDEMGSNSNNSNPSNSSIATNSTKPAPSGHDLLKQAIQLVPEVVKRKEEIDKHFKLLKTVSESLSSRSISDFFHLEDALLHKLSITASEEKDLEQQLQYGSKGDIEDKLRLFLIYYLVNDKARPDQINQLISVLASHINASGSDANEQKSGDKDGLSTKERVKQYFGKNGGELKALKYLEAHRKLMSLGRSTMHSLQGDEAKEAQGSSLSNISMNWGSKLSDMIGKVKEMLPLPGECVVTKIMKRMMNADNMGFANAASISQFTQKNPHLKDLNKNYVTFDPVYMHKNGVEVNAGFGGTRSGVKYFDASVMDASYESAIVFLVGGGSLAEFANIMEFAERRKKSIIYGCTDLLQPNQFLKALTEMADE